MVKNKYINTIDKIDVSEEFKSNLIEKIKQEENKKGVIIIKIKEKITAIIAALGIIACGGIVYATVVPEEWKNNVNKFMYKCFGTEEELYVDLKNVQGNTIDAIANSDQENIEKYTQLLDPDVYGIGDSNGGTLIETNYEQYNYQIGEIKEIKPYKDIIDIKLAEINYGCLEKLSRENTISDANGLVIEEKESTLEEILEYQYKEFKTDWDNYNYQENKTFNDLYFKITGMLLMNGNNLTDEDYQNNSRAKKIKVIFDNEQEEIINLKDTSEMQFIDLSYVQKDISKPIDIKIEVLETYEGAKTNDIYISDIQFGITTNIPQGR